MTSTTPRGSATARSTSAPADGSGLRHRIYWRDTEPVEPGPPLVGDVRADLCIIGGGYTGMWTAHFLKQADPSMEIHIVEADYAGAGASGHNDGFVTPTIGHSMSALVKRFGTETTARAYGVVGRSILELGRFCRKFGVDAELEPNGYYTVATNDGQSRRLDEELELAASLASKSSLEMLEGADARARIGSDEIRKAIKVGGALINPHKLSRGLLRVVREQGVHVHERSPAVYEGRMATGHLVTTPTGRVTADRVLFATNAYQHQFPGFESALRPVWSYAVVTDPLTDEQMSRVTWPGREGFVEARNFIVFGRFTADNRLLFGGGPAPYHYGRDMSEQKYMRNDQLTRYLRGALDRYFPVWRDVRLRYSYGGCVAMTRELMPHVGDRGDGTYYGQGYCGNGIALTHTAGKALRDLILERDKGYRDLLFVNHKARTMPPEPLFAVGAKALTAALAWQDRHPNVIKKPLV